VTLSPYFLLGDPASASVQVVVAGDETFQGHSSQSFRTVAVTQRPAASAGLPNPCFWGLGRLSNATNPWAMDSGQIQVANAKGVPLVCGSLTSLETDASANRRKHSLPMGAWIMARNGPGVRTGDGRRCGAEAARTKLR
jgi:hypothetical protein